MINFKNIFLIISGVAVGALGASSFAFMQKTEHHTEHASQMHAHGMMQVDPQKPIPGVRIKAIKDTKDGYNIHVTLLNFVFSPETVNTAPNGNEGHAHIFVNGKKIQRLYGPWAHLPNTLFKDGENVISVTLNANDHSELMHGEKHVEAEVTVGAH